MIKVVKSCLIKFESLIYNLNCNLKVFVRTFQGLVSVWVDHSWSRVEIGGGGGVRSRGESTCGRWVKKYLQKHTTIVVKRHI